MYFALPQFYEGTKKNNAPDFICDVEITNDIHVNLKSSILILILLPATRLFLRYPPLLLQSITGSPYHLHLRPCTFGGSKINKP